jgi:SAM-dependent methyltransferase
MPDWPEQLHGLGAPALSWRAEDRPCPACGSDRRRLLGRRGGASHHLGLGVETTIVRCRECHLVYPRPFLLPEGNPYDAHTASEYFHAHDAGAKQALGRSLARQTEALLGRKGRVLELGCGRGDLLLGAAREGWEAFGVDMTAAFVSPEPGVEIEIAPVLEARSLERTYDAVWLAAILEHLHEPRAALRRVHGALVDDGVLFIDAPNECSLWTLVGNAYMRAGGRRWAVNLAPSFPPYHVVGFCPRSLARLLEVTGFRDVEIRTLRWTNELPRRSGVWPAIQRAGAEAVLSLGAWIGMGAGLMGWARKAPS